VGWSCFQNIVERKKKKKERFGSKRILGLNTGAVSAVAVHVCALLWGEGPARGIKKVNFSVLDSRMCWKRGERRKTGKEPSFKRNWLKILLVAAVWPGRGGNEQRRKKRFKITVPKTNEEEKEGKIATAKWGDSAIAIFEERGTRGKMTMIMSELTTTPERKKSIIWVNIGRNDPSLREDENQGFGGEKRSIFGLRGEEDDPLIAALSRNVYLPNQNAIGKNQVTPRNQEADPVSRGREKTEKQQHLRGHQLNEQTSWTKYHSKSHGPNTPLKLFIHTRGPAGIKKEPMTLEHPEKREKKNATGQKSSELTKAGKTQESRPVVSRET